MSRKDAINSLFLKKPEAASTPQVKHTDRVRTGAIAAMGSSLQEMTEGAKAAERLQQQLAAGETVIALDPGQIDGSRIADRIAIDVDPGFEALVSSISEYGQQVPILVRPHPEKIERFQIAYGRRRLRAAVRLGQSVKAIVRSLSDADLVIAQGRENFLIAPICRSSRRRFSQSASRMPVMIAQRSSRPFQPTRRILAGILRSRVVSPSSSSCASGRLQKPAGPGGSASPRSWTTGRS